MTALYDLTNEFRDAAAKLEDLDLDEQTVADTLEGMAGELEAKAVSVAAFARNLEATAGSIKAAEADMAARRKALEKRADSLRAYLLRCMEAAGIKKIESPHFALTVKAKPPSVDVFDAEQLPADYMRQIEPPPPAPDKVLIGKALKDGFDVPGARLVTGNRLEVK